MVSNMRKLLTILLMFVALAGYGQSFKTVKKQQLTAGGGTLNIPLSGYVEYWYIYGTATLSSSWTIQGSGTAYEGMVIQILYNATVTLGGNNVTIFGTALTAAEARTRNNIFCYYDGSAWKVSIGGSLNQIRYIDSMQIADYSITTSKMANLTATYIYVGNSSNRPVGVEMTGDVTISNAGVTTIGAKKVKATMMEDLTSAYILVGNATNRPTAVGVSGDITLANTGAMTVDDDKIDSSNIPTGGITVDELNNAANTGFITFPISWDTLEQGAFTIMMPKCYVTKVYVVITKALSATDSAYISFNDHGGSVFTGTGLSSGNISFVASSIIGTSKTATVTGSNEFAWYETMNINTSKETVGGKGIVTVFYLKKY